MTPSTLSSSETLTLREFRVYRMTPHRMLCFSGPVLEKHNAALETLAEKNLLLREKPHGAYSLTKAGYSAMQRIDHAS